MRAFSTLVLASVLAATPACTSSPFGGAAIQNPMEASSGVDQRAYALLQTYAVVVETATEIVRDPDAPTALKHALAQAEHAATPAAETLGVAVRVYIAARADLDAAPQSTTAANAFAIAVNRLGEAAAAAQAPINQLAALVRATRD